MSKLDELIEELCPDGVEFVPLKQIAEVGTGSSDRVNAVEDGKYPFYVRSKTIYRSNRYLFDEESIVIPGEGGIGDIFHYVNGKYDLHQRAYRIHFIDRLVDTKFAYHYLSANFKKFILMKAVNATVTSIRKPMIQDFPFPLPPLPVQQEIVRILDNFTELTTQLTAELTARRKQYEYYRDWLLSQEELNKLCPDGVSYKRLGEIGYFYGGLSGKSKHDFANGNAKFITYMNVYSNLAVDTEISDMVKIGENEKQNTVKHGDILFTGSSETLDECGISSVLTKETNEKLYLNSFCFGFRLIDKDLLLPDFSKYLFRSKEIRKQIIRTASGVTRFNVSREKMEQVIIPVPPLPVQQKIFRILDNFTELIAQLETELEARQKQYEYYRDKLLSFKEATA